MLTIKTNHQFRYVVYGFELTDKEKAEFDYLDFGDASDEDDCRDGDTRHFVRYRGWTYDLGEFMVAPNALGGGKLFADYDGYSGDSFFSGVLVKYSDDCESVKMATYYS